MADRMTDWHKLLVYYINHVIAHESVSFIESSSIGTKLMLELSEEEKEKRGSTSTNYRC
jgi:hypothetical protein